MAVKGKNVRGLQVFSLKQSKKIAAIHDLVCEADGRRICALTIGKHGMFADMRVIPIEDVKSIGEDAVVVESESSIKNLDQVDKGIQSIVRDHIRITGTTVITEDGVTLGKVADITFDPKTGTIEEVEITQGPIKDLSEGRKKIKGEDLVSIGKDNTVVKGDTDEKLAAKPGGGLKGMMQQMQDTIGDVAEKASTLKDKVKRK